jgi:hypothetical protein
VEITHNKLGKITSDWGIIRYGVPQGSILGPLLFLLYVNDLPSGMHSDSKLILYADVTSLLITGKTLHKVRSKSKTILKCGSH